MTQNANYLAHKAKSRSYLNVIQALLWAIFFLPFYLLGGLRLVLDTIPDWWLLLSYISWELFSRVTIYVLMSLIVVISGIAAFIWGRKGRLARICALLFALSVIGLPWLMPYEQPLEPAPGVTIHVVTEPANPIESFVKMMNVLAQDVPCEYDLLGWSAENELYYRRQCGAEEQIWLADPDQPDNPTQMTALPSDLTPKPSQQEQEALREEALETVRAARARPERSARAIYLREGSLRSPDGLWIAIKSQHIYGPQDVMLISTNKRRLQEEQNMRGCAEGGISVHTPEDVRCYLDHFPEEFVRHINDEVAVLFTNPDSTANWIGGAVIYHIPSVSTVTLDSKGDVDLRHTKFKDLSALLAFERVLTDGVLMATLKQKVQSVWKPDTTTDPHADFELQVAAIRLDGHDVAFIALLTGGEADQDKLYCAGDYWIFGDGFSEDETAQCEAQEDQPDSRFSVFYFFATSTRRMGNTKCKSRCEVTKPV
ncbi:MAG: hypothetical protein ACPGWR_14990 [Ardenticatenaceae bacterium]